MQTYIKKSIIASIIIITSLFQITFSASWDTTAHKWAYNNKLTSYKDTAHLNKPVDNTQYYIILHNFLKSKNTERNPQIKKYTSNIKDAKGLFSEIDSIIYDYVKNDNLTVKDYKICSSLIDYTSLLGKNYPQNLRTFDKNNVESYINFLRYIINQKVEDQQIRKNVVKPKGFSLFEDYGYFPSVQNITREEFLVMYYYITKNSKDANDAIIKYYKDNMVIQGYNNKLMLDSNLTYAQLYQFLMKLNNLEEGNSNG